MPNAPHREQKKAKGTAASLDEQVAALLSEFPNRRPGTTCCVAASPHKDLILALKAGGAQYKTISRILSTKFGESMKDGAIGRHFRGECAKCPR